MNNWLMTAVLIALALSQPLEARGQQSADSNLSGCEMPKASGDAKVFLFSTEYAEGLSTTTIGSQDVLVSTGNITIEQGVEPIYIVGVTTGAVIWRLQGAVDRVERLVLSSMSSEPGDAANLPLVGTTGISSERVTFLKRTTCIAPFASATSDESSAAASVVQRETGKMPGVVSGRSAASEFVFPAAVLKTKWGSDLPSTVDESDLVAVEAALVYPAGITDVDPATVTATRPTAYYKVLPDTHGLLQLEKNGIVQRNKDYEFLIRKQMRFPAGLTSIKFRLPRGVPAPEGDPGMSCVYSEETGQISGHDRYCKDRRF